MKEIHILAVLWAFAGVASADLIISEIDLSGDKVEIINIGATTENLTGYYLCNRLNGSPFYPQITVALIDTANSDTSTLSLAPGQVLTLQMTSSFITDASGEVGLYTSSSNFGSTANMIDYVGWGADGQRDSVAASKGIWTSGTFVTVTGILAGQTIQLGKGLAGNSKEEYSLAASTIGEDQVSIPPDPKITSVSLSGTTLTIAFNGPSGTAPASWKVMGSSSLDSFPDDKTGASTITEIPADSGLFQALVDVSGEGDSYFVRIELQ